MAQNSSSGPQVGQRVIYTVSASTFYPADITAINATTGLVRLSVIQPGSTTFTDQQNVQYDGTGTISGSWRYPDYLTGI